MVPRDTGTGWVFEQMVLPALDRNGYNYRTQVDIGLRPGGRRHQVDLLVEDREHEKAYVLVSVKWQQVSGTAEQKIPYEAICLAEAVLAGEEKFRAAYLVLGGEGWSLREFYVSSGLDRHLRYSKIVNIVTLENCIALVNQGKL